MNSRAMEPKPEPAILHVEQLTKSFGGIRAVNHLSLAVDRGELRCVIGPNGAGKSTFFALLSGIHQADGGRIALRGEDITKLPPYRRVRKGLCQKFQTTRIYRGLTVAQNLLIAGGKTPARPAPNDRLAWALETLGLNQHANTPAGLLSHSRQQWLEICLALATRPEVLLLDEPTAGMTSEETALTARFVVELNRQGGTILIVEHDMAFIRSIANKVTVLHEGCVFAEGTIEEIAANRDVQRIYLGEPRT
ncbi:MAG TPA: ABC transporter ATP-binding protein [Burkholderiales bacterium]|nr:ABC transporter ATP-binding protein [Burkholderiales bacterium]